MASNINVNPYVKNAGSWKAAQRDMNSTLLDLNENQFLQEFHALFLREGFNERRISIYPNYDPLLNALGEYCATAPENILITNGADQAIDLVIRVIFPAGSRVVIPSPVFSFYYQMLDINGVVAVPLAYVRRGTSFSLPIKEIFSTIDASDGLILCNPNNPLGAIIPAEELNTLISYCAAQCKPIVVDECYYEYLKSTSFDKHFNTKYLVIIRSFSKYFGLAGLRLGYVLAATELIKDLLKVRGPWDVNHIAVEAAIYCLSNIEKITQAHDGSVNAKVELVKFLNEQKIEVIETYTNFLLIKDTADFRIEKSLRQSGIRVTNCSDHPHNFGLLSGFLRVAIPSPQNLDEFMLAIIRVTMLRPKFGWNPALLG